MPKYSIVIQAGGASTRMGKDKANLPIFDSTILNFIIKSLQSLNQEIIVISNTERKLDYPDISVYSDIYENVGALGGLHAGLVNAKNEDVLMLACDMPFIEKKLFLYMYKLMAGYDIVIPRIGKNKYLEPFRAFYSKRCIPYIENSIEAGNKKMISFYSGLEVRYVEENEVVNFDRDLRSFSNVNTPSDYEKILKISGNN